MVYKHKQTSPTSNFIDNLLSGSYQNTVDSVLSDFFESKLKNSLDSRDNSKLNCFSSVISDETDHCLVLKIVAPYLVRDKVDIKLIKENKVVQVKYTTKRVKDEQLLPEQIIYVNIPSDKTIDNGFSPYAKYIDGVLKIVIPLKKESDTYTEIKLT